MPEPALDQLIQTLEEGTRAGKIRWQEVTGDGNSFVTQRKTGTVTLLRRSGIDSAVTGEYSLVVRDSLGRTVTELSSPGPAILSSSAVSAGARTLPRLFQMVSLRHTGDQPQIQQLIKEFTGDG